MELFTLLRQKVFILLLIPNIILILSYLESVTRRNTGIVMLEKVMMLNTSSSKATKYLVETKNCKISHIDAYNSDVWQYLLKEDYLPCTNLPLLSYVKNRETGAYLRINESLLPSYSPNKICCCYSNVTRGLDNIDNTISISACHPFREYANISADLIKVTCKTEYDEEIYSNVHSIIRTIKIPPQVPPKKPFYNVLLVGIDTMSQLNLIRTMPHTHNFLEQNEWINLHGYNKINDNTFPNLMAILTGMNLSQVYDTCNPEDNVLNNCSSSFIWNNFREAGYLTAFAEDEQSLNTFNYLLKGFSDPPTDFYFRPYFLAVETLPVTKHYFMSYCTGPETSGERVLNLIKDFSGRVLENHPKFGLFWMNSFSHNNMNTASGMDDVFVDFLEHMTTSGSLNNTIMVFFSDHGFRFGKIRYTYSGWLEERLPFNYIWVPKSFREKWPHKFHNLQINSNKLTTPYDLYMTLQEILSISDNTYRIKSSLACPNCKSLLQEITEDRSCKDVAISQHYCTCKGHLYINPNMDIVRLATYFVIDKLHSVVNSFGDESVNCAYYYLRRIISSGITEVSYDNVNQTMRHLLLIFETFPSAVFEATVRISYQSNTPLFSLEGIISRVDRYGDKGDCVSSPILRKYCYCDNFYTLFKKTMNILFNY